MTVNNMTKNKTKLIVANWKMNPGSGEEARMIAMNIGKKARVFGNAKLVVCPPFMFLDEVASVLEASKKVSLGAQDVFIGKGVSHTGEISLDMLKKAGVKYVIIGHSERRGSLDSDEVVKEKLLGVLKGNLKAILCVGEKERNEHGDHFHEVKRQLESAISKLPKKFIKNLVLAYEPVWAIGKSEKEAMKPEQLHEMAIFIKRFLNDVFGARSAENAKILYGGSVTKNNAKDIVEKGNVQGLLVGRESLKTENFVELIREIGN